ncbi:anti-sigma factor antagonist [Dechloromonas sp. TW-R-39-2]|jgi:anti-sigma B factor antagonist/stage II sporulation protein AA (anti-sigma F factor antagonist)|uniref:STAS domain-containing protein n=1 Tax=Dechloromonas sp. TW-R-39-2 TaxID=2654218 RepID=UPI00193E9EF8|nr:STAS domain-containing protein [Dechloromonas sp. TW-R-39-2]QRM19691.1 anti-sigma factor antagonist [Dechloromonas sp. TW-R-39-2]
MIFPTREQSGVLILAISGRIDHVGSETFATSLDPFLEQCMPGKPGVLLDFSAVDYVSSAGLRALMLASRRAKIQGGVFAIACLQPLVQEVFSISRFNLIMPCYPNIELACKVMGS